MATEFEIIRGTTQTLVCYIESETGDALNLTGYTSVTLYADKNLNASAPALSKSATGVSASAGIVTFAFGIADTASLDPGEYLAEVHIVITGGVEYRTQQPFIFRILERVKL